jgi:hypothetical protein
MKLVELMQTKGLKILKNIKMWWLSVLFSTMKVVNKYQTLLVKMQQHSSTLAIIKTNFDHLTNVQILLGLACFLPLLQSMHNFMQFPQKCDVFVFNYLASIKICQATVCNVQGSNNNIHPWLVLGFQSTYSCATWCHSHEMGDWSSRF